MKQVVLALKKADAEEERAHQARRRSKRLLELAIPSESSNKKYAPAVKDTNPIDQSGMYTYDLDEETLVFTRTRLDDNTCGIPEPAKAVHTEGDFGDAFPDFAIAEFADGSTAPVLQMLIKDFRFKQDAIKKKTPSGQVVKKCVHSVSGEEYRVCHRADHFPLMAIVNSKSGRFETSHRIAAFPTTEACETLFVGLMQDLCDDKVQLDDLKKEKNKRVKISGALMVVRATGCDGDGGPPPPAGGKALKAATKPTEVIVPAVAKTPVVAQAVAKAPAPSVAKRGGRARARGGGRGRAAGRGRGGKAKPVDMSDSDEMGSNESDSNDETDSNNGDAVADEEVEVEDNMVLADLRDDNVEIDDRRRRRSGKQPPGGTSASTTSNSSSTSSNSKVTPKATAVKSSLKPKEVPKAPSAKPWARWGPTIETIPDDTDKKMDITWMNRMVDDSDLVDRMVDDSDLVDADEISECMEEQVPSTSLKRPRVLCLFVAMIRIFARGELTSIVDDKFPSFKFQLGVDSCSTSSRQPFFAMAGPASSYSYSYSYSDEEATRRRREHVS